MAPYGQARFADMSSSLASEFGLALAIRKLGTSVEELEAVLGRYTRGKNKGNLRGYIKWFKIESAGWCRLGDSRGFVFPVKSGSFGYYITNYDGDIIKGLNGLPLSEFGDGKYEDKLMYAVHTFLEKYSQQRDAYKASLETK